MESADWDVLIRCKRNPHHQMAQVVGVQLDVDGHLVVPKQKPCEECVAKERPVKLSFIERYRWEKKLLKQISEL